MRKYESGQSGIIILIAAVAVAILILAFGSSGSQDHSKKHHAKPAAVKLTTSTTTTSSSTTTTSTTTVPVASVPAPTHHEIQPVDQNPPSNVEQPQPAPDDCVVTAADEPGTTKFRAADGRCVVVPPGSPPRQLPLNP